MKSTGIVRRIDELGRVVIPKEIRRTMKIKSGEELEIFTSDEELILKKFSTVKLFQDVATEYAEALVFVTGATVVIVDKEEVVVSKGDLRRLVEGAKVSDKLSQLLEDRRISEVSSSELNTFLGVTFEGIKNAVVSPIISGGDIAGGIILIRKDNFVSESDKRQLETASAFLAGQVK